MATRKRQRTVRFPRQRTVEIERKVTLDGLSGDAAETFRSAMEALNRLRLRLHDWQPVKGYVSCKLGRGWSLVVPYGPGEKDRWLNEYRTIVSDPTGPRLVLRGRSNWHWAGVAYVVRFMHERNLDHRMPEVLRTVEQARRELIRNLEERTRWL